METGVDEKAPISLGRPFLCTTKAIIYAEHTKIVLSIKDKKERFTFKNHNLKTPVAPKQFYQQGNQEQKSVPKKKNNRRWRKTKHAETTQLITTLNTKNDHMLPKPCPIKRGDPGVPIIDCTINNTTFPYTVCDIGSGCNVMSKQVYDELFDLSLYPTHIQLQMADQSLRFSEGMVRDVMVRIQEYYIPVDFLVLDMQGDEEIPILLKRLFLYTAKANIYIGSGHIHFNLPAGKVRCQFRTLVNHEQIRNEHNRRRHQARSQAA